MILLEGLRHGPNFEDPSCDFVFTFPDTARLYKLLNLPCDRIRRNTVVYVTILSQDLTDEECNGKLQSTGDDTAPGLFDAVLIPSEGS